MNAFDVGCVDEKPHLVSEPTISLTEPSLMLESPASLDDLPNLLQQVKKDNPSISTPIAAIKVLLEVIKHSKATTMSEFMKTINNASQILKESTSNLISVIAGCDLFLRFVTVTSHDLLEFESCKESLLKSGNMVVEKASGQKQRIVIHASPFIRDGSTILIHSYSRVVMMILIASAKRNKRFQVLVTESRSSDISAARAINELKAHGIPSFIIMDCAVSYFMGKVDMVLVGAEGVVENGGLINQIGTYQIALVAKALHKPFYAAAESFKFVRLFPLSQYDLPQQNNQTILNCDRNSTHSFSSSQDPQQHYAQPLIDYTPPLLITLLFTDLGVLTPSGVSDELIKIHY